MVSTIKKFHCNMENGKAIGPCGSFGVVVEMLQGDGEPFLNSMTAIFNDILFWGKLPEVWNGCSWVTIFKGKEDPLCPN